MKKLIWLASYPKSGNTWLRILLDSILSNNGDMVDINQLDKTKYGFLSRKEFDKFLESESSDLTQEETHFYKRLFFLNFASSLDHDFFLKTHDANILLNDGNRLIPAEVTKYAIYLVRNPLDIVASLANHMGTGLDESITLMGDKGFTYFRTNGGITSNVDQFIGDWSRHVNSWLDDKELNVILIKYEDLVNNPTNTLSKIVSDFGIEPESQVIETAVSNNSFSLLSKQENQHGFSEKHVNHGAFFRKGRPESWKEELSTSQVNKVISQHGLVMEKLGYLDQNSGV